METKQGTTMRLLRKPAQYIAALCAYLANAIHATYSFIRHSNSIQRHTDFGVVLPLLIGVSLVMLLVPTAFRHTSYVIEKAVVIVTGVLLMMCVIGYLNALGVQRALLPHGDLIFVMGSWLAAALVAAFTVQVLSNKRGDARPQ